jgi:hypothetical protein
VLISCLQLLDDELELLNLPVHFSEERPGSEPPATPTGVDEH